MSTRRAGRSVHEDRPPSGVHPVAPSPSFLVLVADSRFATWLADEARAYGEATIVKSAASAIEHKPPSGHWTAALLDVRLTEGSGFSVLEALRLVDTDLPALLFADGADASVSNLAFEKRASLLTKPVPPGHVQMFLESPLVREHGGQRRARSTRVARPPGRDPALLEITEAWRQRYHLSWTEADVLHLALKGLERAEIADRRSVSENTIKSQVSSLLSKTECASLSELVAEAMHELLFETRRLRR